MKFTIDYEIRKYSFLTIVKTLIVADFIKQLIDEQNKQQTNLSEFNVYT